MSTTRRPGPTRRVRVTEWVDGRTTNKEDRLVTEEPLEIRVRANGGRAERLGVTMRTPGSDFELAAGLALAEGVIAGLDDLATVAYCTDDTLSPQQEYNVVTLNLAGAARANLGSRRLAATSACGVCGIDSLEAVDALVERIAPAVDVPVTPLFPDLLLSLPAALRSRQRLFETTGGLHAAGVFATDGSCVVVREDVGRHNAVDKAVGHCLLNRLDTQGTVLCTSGRLGFEIVQKAAVAGVLGVVAVGAPSNLAVDLARRVGITVVGFVRGHRMVIYSGVMAATASDGQDDVPATHPAGALQRTTDVLDR